METFSVKWVWQYTQWRLSWWCIVGCTCFMRALMERVQCQMSIPKSLMSNVKILKMSMSKISKITLSKFQCQYQHLKKLPMSISEFWKPLSNFTIKKGPMSNVKISKHPLSNVKLWSIRMALLCSWGGDFFTLGCSARLAPLLGIIW